MLDKRVTMERSIGTTSTGKTIFSGEHHPEHEDKDMFDLHPHDVMSHYQEAINGYGFTPEEHEQAAQVHHEEAARHFETNPKLWQHHMSMADFHYDHRSDEPEEPETESAEDVKKSVGFVLGRGSMKKSVNIEEGLEYLRKVK